MRLSLFSTNILAVGALYQGRRNSRLLQQRFSIEDNERSGDLMNSMMKAIQQGVDPDAIDLLSVSTGKDSQTSSKHPRFGVWAGIDDVESWRVWTDGAAQVNPAIWIASNMYTCSVRLWSEACRCVRARFTSLTSTRAPNTSQRSR
mgnify:CR=1 FL=1